MNRRRIGILLIGIGVLLAAVAGVFVFFQANDAEQLRANAPKHLVAVAAVDIPERTLIADNQIQVVTVPENSVPQGAANYLPPDPSNTADIETHQQALINQVKGQYTAQRVYRGEIFNTERLGQKAAQNTPSYVLPAGKVAFPFPVKLNGGSPANDRILVAYLDAVRPGDFVDFYYSTLEFPTTLTSEERDRSKTDDAIKYLYTRRVMQNLKVVNVGFFPGSDGKVQDSPSDQRYLTFEVTPDEALTLKWLRDAATLVGNLDLVLRSPLDTQSLPNQSITFDTMSRQFGIGSGR